MSLSSLQPLQQCKLPTDINKTIAKIAKKITKQV